MVNWQEERCTNIYGCRIMISILVEAKNGISLFQDIQGGENESKGCKTVLYYQFMRCLRFEHRCFIGCNFQN